MISYNLFFILYSIIAITGLIYFLIRYKIRVVQENVFPIILIILLAILASIRPFEVKDTLTYYMQYKINYTIEELLKLGAFGVRNNGMEVIYLVFMSLIKMLNIPFRGFLFISAFINCYTSYIGLLKISEYLTKEKEFYKKNYNIGIIIYFISCFGLHYSCIAIRAGMSIGLGLLALGIFLTAKKKKEKFISIVLFCFSVLLHFTSLLFIPICCIYFLHLKIKREIWGLAWIIALIMLWYNVGIYITPVFVRFISRIISFIGIAGFSGYLYSLDVEVGTIDWLIVFFIGLIFLCVFIEHDHYRETAFIILFGLYIITLLYPIRAIERAYDFFLFFTIPYMVKSYEVCSKNILLILSHLLYFALMFVIQFRLCFF